VTKPEGEIKKGLSIPDLLKHDIALEADAIKMYNDSANVCAAEGDHVSKAIFEKLLDDENEHLDEFQTTLEHFEKMGDVYLATLVD
jgi:bacterioferritin